MPVAGLLHRGPSVPSADRPFLNFQVEPDLLEAVDEARWEFRFPSRVAAIKALLRLGLAHKAELRRAEG